MADVIDLLSSDEENVDEYLLTPVVVLEEKPKEKKRKALEDDVICLDEDSEPITKKRKSDDGNILQLEDSDYLFEETNTIFEKKNVSEDDDVVEILDDSKENLTPSPKKSVNEKNDSDDLILIEDNNTNVLRKILQNNNLKKSNEEPLFTNMIKPVNSDSLPVDSQIKEKNIDLEKENLNVSEEEDGEKSTLKKMDDDESISIASDVSGETSKPKESKKEMELPENVQNFLDACANSVQNKKRRQTMLKKFKVIKSVYNRAQTFVKSEDFKKLMIEYENGLKENPTKGVIYFHGLYTKLHENPDVDEKNQRTLEKLYRIYRKVVAKIKMYEEVDVNFEEEDDSAYIKMQRYRIRAAQIYKKIKIKEKEDHHTGRIYYSRLDFASSKYPEINKAINKAFRDREKNPLPNYSDVNKCIRKCVKKENLNISEDRLKREIQNCFENLGNLIQQKRKRDLAMIHTEYLEDLMTDPATSNKELGEKLKNNKIIAEDAMQKVMEKYTKMQALGLEPTLSEDSDNSKVSDSDSD